MRAEILEFNKPRSIDEQWECGDWLPREELFLTKVRVDGEDIDVHFMAHNGADAITVTRAMSEQYHQMEQKIEQLRANEGE